ncbi:MAG: 2',3'-cyclic-nucleotide 2'-phosphodiesterase (5'-nucleotidase family) [Candidatus Krumholzibacteriia bacterium]|jgi:2',3'-cyclic-nucleotide 2'-phosphodiesterase (5'-nucleotidase family)
MWNENVPFLMVDAGDLFGRRSKDEKHQTEFLCEMTGDLGYDGIGFGERDLNYGLPFLLEMIEKYGLPFTNANVRETATGKLILPEYLIVERNGIKYGLVSVLDPALKIITMTANEADFTVADPVATLRELLPRMRKEADCIVLLGHMGENNTEPVLKEVKGIDISVTGHTYRSLQTERIIDDTAIFSATHEGRYIGRGNLFIEEGTGRVMAIDVAVTSLDAAIDSDPDMQGKLDQYKTDLVSFKEAKRLAYPRNMGSDKEQFLGDRSCMACHDNAWQSYVNSSHRTAFSTLRAKGQSEEPECLSCHTTGYMYKNGYNAESKASLQNVQCEACHGYGTEHARDGKWVAQAKDSCVVCHDQENSPEFDYATYWEKIKH